MNWHELRKAVTDGSEMEYLFQDDLWVPAIIKSFQDGSIGSPRATLQLLQHPRNHSGLVPLSENDLANRLRLKG